MRNWSLTRRLIGGVLLAELLCAASFSAVAIAHEMHGRKRAFDVMLRGRADSLLGAVQDAEDPEDNVTVDPGELVLPKEDAYAVLNPAGRVLGHSLGPLSGTLMQVGATISPGYFNFITNRESYRAICFEGVRVIDREDHGGLRRPVIVLYAAPTRALWHEATEAARYYVASSTLLLLVTGLVLVWFLRGSLSPLNELAALAGRVSTRSWDFEPPEAALRTRELKPIAQSIQKLLLGLQRSFERQRQFTGDAAHELKTSMAVLKSSLQLLAMRSRTPEQYQLGLEELGMDVLRMEGLIEQMLALARLEEDAASSDQEVDLGAMARSVVERLQPFTEAREITIQMVTEETGPIAMQEGDADILISNLMMNAVQHSLARSMVSVSVVSTPQGAELRIADAGEGIPETALPHVFERFYRADISRSRNRGGAGLGLAICKAIVERSHGTISIHSVEKVGTEVRVALPATP
jgi:signal transduction histidine kinase